MALPYGGKAAQKWASFYTSKGNFLAKSNSKNLPGFVVNCLIYPLKGSSQ
jgi:hypothetical protein